MKKYIISGIAVLAIAAVAVVNITLSNGKTNALSDLQLANVEALASGEGNCENDEVNITATQNDCKNGKNCECTLCISGSTDCSPSCPCC